MIKIEMTRTADEKNITYAGIMNRIKKFAPLAPCTLKMVDMEITNDKVVVQFLEKDEIVAPSHPTHGKRAVTTLVDEDLGRLLSNEDFNKRYKPTELYQPNTAPTSGTDCSSSNSDRKDCVNYSCSEHGWSPTEDECEWYDDDVWEDEDDYEWDDYDSDSWDDDGWLDDDDCKLYDDGNTEGAVFGSSINPPMTNPNRPALDLKDVYNLFMKSLDDHLSNDYNKR